MSVESKCANIIMVENLSIPSVSQQVPTKLIPDFRVGIDDVEDYMTQFKTTDKQIINELMRYVDDDIRAFIHYYKNTNSNVTLEDFKTALKDTIELSMTHQSDEIKFSTGDNIIRYYHDKVNQLKVAYPGITFKLIRQKVLELF